MGNTNPSGRGGGDLSQPVTKSSPLRFHDIHSDNVQLTHDRRRAKRIESFCKGICFSHRPIAIYERVFLQFAEVSTSWSGVVRFGFMSHDPCTLNGSELPRYACPDLTNKPGYWAKALSERYSEGEFVLSFYVTRNGDVMFGVNGEEKGVFFSGVSTSLPLWALVDIYGNTTAMEFVNGPQLNNMVVPQSAPDLNISTGSLNSTGGSQTNKASSSLSNGTQSLGGNIPIRYHTHVTFGPLPFHMTKGRNVSLSSDRTIAARSVEEYCNAYVFTLRALQPGERVVIQMLAVDHTFYGGMAFGLTACDPSMIDPDQLPDDADLLLDRPEYWVVNKDVSGKSEAGDELSFHLTEDGEVRFGRNGHHITTLMHVDKTLPLWAFFDVYGYTQKIKCLGTVLRTNPPPPIPQHRSSVSSVSGLTVALPPPRGSTTPTTPTTSNSTITPPPRPPPPRSSPGSRRGSTVSSTPSQSPPLLPPKQHRPLPAQPPMPGTILTPQPAPGSQASGSVPLRTGSLPHRPVPQPVPPPSQLPHHVSIHGLPPAIAPREPASSSQQQAPVASRSLPAPPPAPSIPERHHPPVPPKPGVQDCAQENADNASNECSVCFEKAVDCVIYTCGHMCMCYECAMDIKENQGGLCPICRQPIKDLIKTFRS